MTSKKASLDLLNLLKLAVAREIQVSVQYMLQHTLWGGKENAGAIESPNSPAGKFVSSHSPVWLPGVSLKKIAITEMRHAEKIAERLVFLGEEYSHYPTSFKIGKSLSEILLIDRTQEEEAIELYTRIVERAEKEKDQVTRKIFVGILSEEEKHSKIFSNMLKMI